MVEPGVVAVVDTPLNNSSECIPDAFRPVNRTKPNGARMGRHAD
jgi:hypothetical protein